MNKKSKSHKTDKKTPFNAMIPPNPFDPTECVHEWTMWRAAVNRCIVNKVMSDEEDGLFSARNQDPGFCLLHIPLQKFIRLGIDSVGRVEQMSGISNDKQTLNVRQFVYFGIPRPKVKKYVSEEFNNIPVEKLAAKYT